MLLGRTKVAAMVPTIIPVSDCVHQLSNTIGNIVKLLYFHKVSFDRHISSAMLMILPQTLAIVCTVIAKIHKSHLGMAEFKGAHKLVPGHQLVD